MRKIIYFGMMMFCLFLFTTSFNRIASADHAPGVRLMINGKFISMAHPVNTNARVLVPVRVVSEKLNAAVQFIAADKPIIIKHGNNIVQFTIGKSQAYVNGKSVQLDVPAKIIDGISYVPIRFVAAGLDTEVKWDAAAQVVVVEEKHTASEKVLDTQTALAMVKKHVRNGVTIAPDGTQFIRFYKFMASNEYVTYENEYLVDKYTGEMFTYYIWDGDLHRMTQ